MCWWNILLLILAAAAHSTDALAILSYAMPVTATSHQLAIRRAAEALAAAGHAVTLLEPAAAKARRLRLGQAEGKSIGNLTVLFVQGLISDEDASRRFDSGESFPRIWQEVNDQFVPEVLPILRKQHFDVAVVDALYPVIAKELCLPSVHVQCASDPDALEGVWLHYGFSSNRELGLEHYYRVLSRMAFAVKWALSLTFVGSHQDYNTSLVEAESEENRISWADYYQDYVAALLLQGVPECAVPRGGAGIAAAHPQRVKFIGSLTDRPDVAPPVEAAELVADMPTPALALVAFGTHLDMKCPVEVLKGLAEVDLVAVILVEACRGVKDLPRHIFPKSKDQAAWLRVPGMRLALIHGGIHSLLEAVGAGIPVACMPGKVDQPANCRDLQRQHLGWGVHPEADAEEAAAVFRMLLDGNHSDWHWKPQAEALAAAGGPRGLVQRVEELAELGRLQRPTEGKSKSERLSPFFVAPFRWHEGWLLVLAPLPVLVLLAAECMRCWVMAQAKVKVN